MKFPATRLLPVLLVSLSAMTAQAGDAPVVSQAWARATPPGVGVGAAYMVITGGNRDDRLVGASSGRADMVELHDVTEVDGVAKMREIEALEIPAKGRVELAPKGRHLMLMGLDAPLVAGQRFDVTLRFEVSGPQVVTVTVRSATDAGTPAH